MKSKAARVSYTSFGPNMTNPGMPQPSPAQLFAMQVEGAHEKFRLLISMIRREVTIACADRALQFRAPATIIKALSQAVLFEATRIHRALEHGKQFHFVSNEDRKRFMRDLKVVVGVRDVNEHGADHHRKGGSPPIRPSMHVHDKGNIALDETSLIILGEDRIMMGPINLADIGKTLQDLCLLAGFRAIDPPQGSPSGGIQQSPTHGT